MIYNNVIMVIIFSSPKVNLNAMYSINSMWHCVLSVVPN